MILNPSTPIDLGVRQKPAVSEPVAMLSWGESVSGDVLVYDTGRTRYDIPLHFRRVTAANVALVRDYLRSLAGLEISVTLDSGDDLGCGLSGTVTTLIYVPNTFRSEYRYGTIHEIFFTLRHRIG